MRGHPEFKVFYKNCWWIFFKVFSRNIESCISLFYLPGDGSHSIELDQFVFCCSIYLGQHGDHEVSVVLKVVFLNFRLYENHSTLLRQVASLTSLFVNCESTL